MYFSTVILLFPLVFLDYYYFHSIHCFLFLLSIHLTLVFAHLCRRFVVTFSLFSFLLFACDVQ